MLRNFALVLVSLVSMAWPAAVSADTVQRSVAANKTTVVHSMFRYARDSCQPVANAQASIRRQGQHGKAVIKRFRQKLPANSRICPGMIASGPAIYYTPKRGFRGSDTVVVDYQTNAYLSTARPITRTYTILITVK